jgi:iron complex transport system substrate-binding protein
MDPRASTAAIDREVRRLVEQGVSVYRIDSEALGRLQPDPVVTQDQCEVCAVSLSDVTAAVCQISRRDVKVVSLSPLSLSDVLADVLTVARALGIDHRFPPDALRPLAGRASRCRPGAGFVLE